MSKANFLIAAGGTGGHLFPAMAVAEQLDKLTNGKAVCHFVGSPDRMESHIVPAKGYPFHPMKISGLTKSLKTLMLPFRIAAGISSCRSLIKKEDIAAVICAGAYLSYPPGFAAGLEKIPLILMESNVNPGKAIKMLSSRANMIVSAFEESLDYFEKPLHSKIRPYGNPVRDFILNLPDKKQAREKFGLNPARPTILIFGGSLGARSINNAMSKYLSQFAEKPYQIIWQTGKNFEHPKDIPANVKITTFIDDMASAYSAADLVVARSGATTVAELCVAGKPSVLVPLPSASNNEQLFNGKVLEQRGAAIIVDNNAIEHRLYDLAEDLMSNPGKLSDMGKAALLGAKPDAAERTAREILNIIKY